MYYTITGELSEQRTLTLTPATITEGEGANRLIISVAKAKTPSSVQLGFDYPAGLNRRNTRLSPFLTVSDGKIIYDIPSGILVNAGRIYVQFVAVSDSQVWRSPITAEASFLCTASLASESEAPGVNNDMLSEVRLTVGKIDAAHADAQNLLNEIRNDFSVDDTPTEDSLSLVRSGGVAAALSEKQPAGDYATNTALTEGLAGKQPNGNFATNEALNAGLSDKLNASGGTVTADLNVQGTLAEKGQRVYSQGFPPIFPAPFALLYDTKNKLAKEWYCAFCVNNYQFFLVDIVFENAVSGTVLVDTSYMDTWITVGMSCSMEDQGGMYAVEVLLDAGILKLKSAGFFLNSMSWNSKLSLASYGIRRVWGVLKR